MGYMLEIRKLRKQMQQAYAAQEYKKASLLARKIIQIYLDKDPCKSMEYASDMHNLAVTLDTLGMHQRALEYYQRAAMLKKNAAGETLSYADTLNNLAIAYAAVEDFAQALECHKEVLQIRKKKLGDQHIDTIHSILHIGNVYADQQQYETALEYHQQALKEARKTKKFPLLDQSDILGEIAADYHGIGNYCKAMDAYEKALQINEKEVGTKNFPEMIWKLALAEVCEQIGHFEWAVEYCEQAIEIRHDLIQESHLDYANSLNGLARLAVKAKLFEKSLSCHQKVLDIIKEILGKEHLFYLDTKSQIGVDEAMLGNGTKAIELCTKALQEKRVLMGNEHPQIAVSLMHLGWVYEKIGDPMKALQAFRHALTIRQNALGRYHAAYADTLEGIAYIFDQQGAYEAAASYLSESMQLRRDANNPDEEAYIHTILILAKVQQKAGANTAATMLCEEGLQKQKQIYGNDHPKCADARIVFADVLAGQGQYEKAMEQLEKAAQIQKEMLDEDSPYYLDTLEKMAQVAIQQEDFAAAIRYFQAKNDGNFEETPQEIAKAAETLLALACCYCMQKNQKKAEAYHTEAQEKMERSGIAPTERYQIRLRAYEAYIEKGKSPFAQANTEHGRKEKRRLQKAVKLFSEIFAQQSKMEGFSPQEFSRNAMFMGDVLHRLGKLEEALSWYEKAEKEADGMQYVQVSQRMGEIWLTLADLEKAYQKLSNAKKYIEEYDSVKTELYCQILGDLGDCCDHMMHKEEARSYYQPYYRLYRELHLPKNQDYIKRVERVSQILAEEKCYHDAAECYSELALVIRQQEGENERFSKVLLKTAACHTAQGNQKEAETLLDRALLLGSQEGRKNIAYGKLCDKIGRMYAKNESWERAADTLTAAYDLTLSGEKCLTKDGRSALLRALQNLQDTSRYHAVKEGRKMQENA